MKKQFTLVQKALGICAIVSIIVVTCIVWVTFQMNGLLKLETTGTAKIIQENEVSRLIAQANHHTTKMASSFKNVLLRGEGEGAATTAMPFRAFCSLCWVFTLCGFGRTAKRSR